MPKLHKIFHIAKFLKIHSPGDNFSTYVRGSGHGCHMAESVIFSAGALLVLHLSLSNDETIVFIAVLHPHPKIVWDAELLFQSHGYDYGETAFPLNQFVEVTGEEAYTFGEVFLFDSALL